MSHRLREASLHVVEGTSLVVPVIVEGLPEEIETLGRRWRRKRELHMTAVSAAVIERAGRGREGTWDTVVRVASGRAIGPISATPEVRRVRHPDRPELETLIVMVDAPGLARLHADLSAELGAELSPPPAHVTVYSTDPAEGIGIDDERELADRAPSLSDAEQDDVRRAMGFGEVFPDDDGTDGVFTPEVLGALAYAARIHRHQLRKGTDVPYLTHLISVAALVAEDGGGPDEVIGALLHDSAEDQGGESRLQDIRRRFGSRPEEIVRALTDPPGESWRVRKDRYLNRLRAEADEGILRVCNADKLHNARAIVRDREFLGDRVWARIGHSARDTAWYYGELASILTEKRPDSPLSSELADRAAALSAGRESGTRA